ncbi:MAG: preprotein translocase subunit SecY [Anaerolineae bacterium]|nr:preprotein translocase subunit SecY [Anaerolineae bacterium]
MIQAVRSAFALPDLRRKILYTFLILAIYRLFAHVPVPGVNSQALEQLFASNQLLGLLDLLSGGALANFSVMAMGVYPYITATIILQLLTPIIPQLQALQDEGEQGRNKLNRYGWYLTLPLAALQAYGQAVIMTQMSGGVPILESFGFRDAPLTTVTILITMTAGTLFAVWLGELISEQGIGNGTSIIILGGIVTRLPQNLLNLIVGEQWLSLILFLIITTITAAGIVIVQEGKLMIWVQYSSRTLGQRGGRLRQTRSVRTHIPLRVNMAGMIPLIFAQSLMVFPSTIAGYFLPVAGQDPAGFLQTAAYWVDQVFNPRYDIYWPLYFLMVVAFTYFYTDVIFQQQNMAENLRKQGASIPGIRPGKRTETYLTQRVRRITMFGALFLGLVAVLPWLVDLFLRLLPTTTTAGVTGNSVMLISSTGLLIVVGVVLDTMRQLEAQLQMRHYDKFLRRGILG